MLYIVSLEPLETRYTAQWQKWFKEEFPKAIEIPGDTLSELQNNKNFLDPFQTNIWKSEQIIKISNLFREGKIKEGDKFLFLDGWHYGIIALKYMSTLSNIKVEIMALWHAGSYDENDLLGTSGLFEYFSNFEDSLFRCINKSFVATSYHKNLIWRRLTTSVENIFTTGFPYKFKGLSGQGLEKENLVVFPHRMSIEKQPEILKDLEKDLNKYNIECFFCQEHKLSKEEYHKVLERSKIVFSASLQETWGIGTFEGLYYGCIPVVPYRLSYCEMYEEDFSYPSFWTENWRKYRNNKENLLNYIIIKIVKYNDYIDKMKKNLKFLQENYCTFTKIKEEIEK